MKYVLHPKQDDHGQPVRIHEPCHCSPHAAWSDRDTVATVTPGSSMPPQLSDSPIASWRDVPTRAKGWERLANAAAFQEPPFNCQPGKAPAAGAVILEPDQRLWVISPCNAFGGYTNAFPKGRIERGLSTRASAVKEAYEETGLKVELTAFLCDATRSTTVTRYYLARRVAGDPSDMGWESQAVHLVHLSQLAEFAAHPNDRPIVHALLRILSAT
jgi:ADP-ribose pyrophosphatase YjhB (NUDIX family)